MIRLTLYVIMQLGVLGLTAMNAVIDTSANMISKALKIIKKKTMDTFTDTEKRRSRRQKALEKAKGASKTASIYIYPGQLHHAIDRRRKKNSLSLADISNKISALDKSSLDADTVSAVVALHKELTDMAQAIKTQHDDHTGEFYPPAKPNRLKENTINFLGGLAFGAITLGITIIFSPVTTWALAGAAFSAVSTMFMIDSTRGAMRTARRLDDAEHVEFKLHLGKLIRRLERIAEKALSQTDAPPALHASLREKFPGLSAAAPQPTGATAVTAPPVQKPPAT